MKKNEVHSNIKYQGRFDFSDPTAPKFSWSSTTISTIFSGTGVSAILESYGISYFTVLIDGKIVKKSLFVSDRGEYILASNLENRKHEISLIKRTEFNISTVKFWGFKFENGESIAKLEEKNRKIEIIGDSISCGFGIEGNEFQEYDPKYDNANLSYGTLTAKELNADHRIIACSGYGVIRNYGGEMVDTMPKRCSYIINGKEEKWNFNNWIPQVVVINLGTNDFSENYNPDREAFVKTYIEFINFIHKNYPDSKIICSIGPIVEGEILEMNRSYIKNDVVDFFRKNNNNYVHFFEFEHQNEKDGFGISFHPSIETHKNMASLLAKEIRNIMSWD
jgi:lysophospholipase L1-like esterase